MERMSERGNKFGLFQQMVTEAPLCARREMQPQDKGLLLGTQYAVFVFVFCHSSYVIKGPHQGKYAHGADRVPLSHRRGPPCGSGCLERTVCRRLWPGC